MNIKKLKQDVRGAALVYVIVAAAIITLMGAATTVTAYVNLRATEVQEQSDNNFYSADTIMNSIVSGLETDVSTAYETAYIKVITNLNTYPNMAKAEEDFTKIFSEELNSIFNDGAESFEFLYSISHIQGYMQDAFAEDVQFTISALNGNNRLDVTDDGVVLRNLHVTYEDDSGYYDEILTDVKIAVPDFDPRLIGSMPQPNYFVVDDGLEISIGTGLQIRGDAYINERESDKSAILLKNSTSLSVLSPIELIAGGLIKTEENASLTLKGTREELDGNKIWTENFDLGRHTTTDISGQIHVYDDLEINGSNASVSLGGEYYGYSKSNTKADESSSINVNGAHAKLDIQQLDMLILAGSSYISTSEVVSDNAAYQNKNDLQLGEALSVKSNQIAYLVDDKEFSNADIKNFVSNPMSYTEYETMCSSNTNWDTVASKLVNKRLSYGKTYAQYGASVMPVFSNKDNGTVYLYLKFSDPDKAATYFVDVYKHEGANATLLSQRLRTYAAQYIDSLQLNKDTSLLINENYINPSVALYTDENLPLITDGLGYDQSKPDQTSMDNLLNKFKTDYLDNNNVDGNGEKYKVMYQKLIDTDQLKAFISGATTAANQAEANKNHPDHHTNNVIEVIENGVSLKGTTGAKAIVVDNAGKEAYELGDGKGIVIVSGDLHLTGNWLGTIIVGGRAYCTDGDKNNPIEITVDSATVSSVLPLYFITQTGDTTTSMSVANIFKGYNAVSANTATDDEGINADMISNCITFTNWNRY